MCSGPVLGAVLRQRDRDPAAVRGRDEPVDRGLARRVDGIGVHDDALAGGVVQVVERHQEGLLPGRLLLQREVRAPARHQAPVRRPLDLSSCLDPRPQRGPPRHGVEVAARQVLLRLRPGDRVLGGVVLEPPVVLGDLHPVVAGGDRDPRRLHDGKCCHGPSLQPWPGPHNARASTGGGVAGPLTHSVPDRETRHVAMVRVLLVDDQEPFLRAMAAVVAETPGFEVVGRAASGEEALDLAATLLPDLVLMDVNLPGIDGLEATRRLLARRPAAWCCCSPRTTRRPAATSSPSPAPRPTSPRRRSGRTGSRRRGRAAEPRPRSWPRSRVIATDPPAASTRSRMSSWASRPRSVPVTTSRSRVAVHGQHDEDRVVEVAGRLGGAEVRRGLHARGEASALRPTPRPRAGPCRRPSPRARPGPRAGRSERAGPGRRRG